MVKNKRVRKKVYEYNTGIYKVPLCVTHETDVKRLAKLFKVCDDNNKWGPLVSEQLTGCALTAYAIRVKDNKSVMLVVLIRKIDINTAAHEAYHVVEAYSEHYDLNQSCGFTNEAKAYLTGWVTECIYNSK